MARSYCSGFAVRCGHHACVPYARREDLLALFGVHLTAALECGEKILFVGEDAGSMLEQLPLATSATESLVARGQLATRPVLDGFGPAADPDRVVAVLRAEAEAATFAGYLGLRVCVDVPWIESDLAKLLACEQRITALLADELTEVALICHYDSGLLEESIELAVRAAHPITLDAVRAQRREPLLHLVPLRERIGLHVRGEIDRTNVEEFAAVLRSVHRAGENLHLELEELRYADVAAVRLLAQTANLFPNGHRLVLHSPAPIVLTTLKIYGWDRLPTLVIEGGDI